MIDIVDIFVYSFWIGLLCAVIYTAIDSPIRPVQNWVSGWQDAFRFPLRFWIVTFLIALIISASLGLEILLANQIRFGSAQVKVFLLPWQVSAADSWPSSPCGSINGRRCIPSTAIAIADVSAMSRAADANSGPWPLARRSFSSLSASAKA